MRKAIKISGTSGLLSHLKKSQDMSEVKHMVKKHTALLHTDMTREATFSGDYTTGATKRSISMQMASDGFSGMVMPGTHYSPYLEYGTRFMSAQPFVRPAFEKRSPLFISDLQKLLK